MSNFVSNDEIHGKREESDWLSKFNNLRLPNWAKEGTLLPTRTLEND
jgi:hypothetical protein